MRKKYLSALLFGALLVTSAGTFTSCKDYDDDINNLQEQITANANAIKALEELVKAGKYVSGVAIEGQTITFTFSDGSTTPIAIPEGENGQVVEVKNDELYIDNEPTGIKVTKDPEKAPVKVENGTWWTLGENGEYTNTNIPVSGVTVSGSEETGYEFTIWNQDGKQTVKLPTAASTISKLTVVDELTFGYISDANGNETDEASSILWGFGATQTDAMKKWNGPKGAVAANQLMLGPVAVAEAAVEVLPASVDLSAQKLELYDSKGNVAPVTVKAVANNEDDLAVDDSRAASSNGKWNLVLTIDDTVNKDNIASTFDVNGKSKLYALAVNGVVMTGYDIVVDVEQAASKLTLQNGSAVLTLSYKDSEDKLQYAGVSQTSGPTPTINKVNLQKFKIGSNTITFLGVEGAKIYDAYITLNDPDAAGRYEVTVDGMTITSNSNTAEKLGSNGIDITINVLDVTGNKISIPAVVRFDKDVVSSIDMPKQTFTLAPTTTRTIIVDLGNTFTDLTDTQADRIQNNVTWSILNGSKTFSAGAGISDVEYYKTKAGAENETENDKVTLNGDPTIKTVKYARITLPAVNTAGAPGLNTFQITLTDGTNEIKKVKGEFTFELPAFNDIFPFSALVSEGTYSTKLGKTTGGSSTPSIDYTLAFNFKAESTGYPQNLDNVVVSYANIGDENVTPTDPTYGEISSDNIVALQGTIVNAQKQALIASELETTMIYNVVSDATTDNFKVSKTFTTEIHSEFEQPKLVYYVDGVAQDVAKLEAGNIIKPLYYTGENNDVKQGLAIQYGKGENEFFVSAVVDGVKILNKDKTPAIGQVKTSMSVENVNNAEAIFYGGGTNPKTIKISETVKKGNLIVTFTDANGVNTKASIKFE